MKHGTLKMLAVALLVTIGATTALAQAIPQVHYLRFNEGSGFVTADLALPGVGSTPSVAPGGLWDTNAPKLGFAAIKLPSSLAAGTNVKLNVPTNLTGSWTIEMWLRDFDTTSTLRYFLGDSTAGAFRIYRSGVSPSNILIAGTGLTTLTVTAALPYQVWTHFAVTYDSTTGLLTAYVNGTQAAQNTQATPLSFVGTGAAGLSVGGYATSTQFFGSIDEFRLWNTVRTQAQIMAAMNVQLNSVSDDVAVTALVSPTSSVGTDCTPLSATEPVTFTITNYGTNTLAAGTFFQGDLSVDGGTPVTEFFTTTAALATGQSESFTFLATADLSILGPHSVAVTATVAGDLDPANDTLTAAVNSGSAAPAVTSYPFIENFDGSLAQNSTVPPAGWVQDTADATGTDSDWYMHYGATSSINTGPTADHTTGATTIGAYYAYVEDSVGSHAQVNLLTPCLDLSLLPSPRLQFWLNSYNGLQTTYPDNLISVDVITYPGGAVTTDVFGPQGHLPGQAPTWAGNAATEWQLQTVDLTAFAGQLVRLQFRASSNQTPQYHDIAIDDVSVFDFVQGNGQPGQPGVAVLDINNAQNFFFGGGDPYSGDNGPFKTNGTPGGPLNFTLAGEPNQPLILLVAPLNVQNASYPNIGQFDIGGPLDVNGIPTLLQVIGDGFNPLTFIDALHRTGASGATILNFQVPPLPLGVLGAFQAAFATNNGFFFAMANAVELTII